MFSLWSRRDVLHLGSATLIVIAGCTTTSPSSPDTEQTTEHTGSSTPRTDSQTRTPTDDILIDLYNETSSELSVHYTLVNGTTVIVEGETQLPAREFKSVPSKIEQIGEYELTITTSNGTEESSSFSIDGYDKRNGSNIVAWISEDRIDLAIEN